MFGLRIWAAKNSTKRFSAAAPASVITAVTPACANGSVATGFRIAFIFYSFSDQISATWGGKFDIGFGVSLPNLVVLGILGSSAPYKTRALQADRGRGGLIQPQQSAGEERRALDHSVPTTPYLPIIYGPLLYDRSMKWGEGIL